MSKVLASMFTVRDGEVLEGVQVRRWCVRTGAVTDARQGMDIDAHYGVRHRWTEFKVSKDAPPQVTVEELGTSRERGMLYQVGLQEGMLFSRAGVPDYTESDGYTSIVLLDTWAYPVSADAGEPNPVQHGEFNLEVEGALLTQRIGGIGCGLHLGKAQYKYQVVPLLMRPGSKLRIRFAGIAGEYILFNDPAGKTPQEAMRFDSVTRVTRPSVTPERLRAIAGRIAARYSQPAA